MDRGMGKSAFPQVGKPADFGAARQQSARPASQLVSRNAPPPATRPAPQPAAKPARQILEGYVKDGVVHLLGGELPDGIFVKIIRE
jgi:probable phosphoglycerate mutase